MLLLKVHVLLVVLMQRSCCEELTRDDDLHDLIGAFQDLVHAHIAQEALHWVIFQVAIAAAERGTCRRGQCVKRNDKR